MSEVKWTKEQLQAINEKGTDILVAAAAGSGKTAVLVERIINKIINEKVDIDHILVVTFTNAAASEMRQRILDAIYKKLDEEPENEHIQKQTVLISKAKICTIHSFCLDIIKNNFYEIDISPNCRIGEQTEIELLKQEVLEDIFEEKYTSENQDFLKLINSYTSYRGDESLKEIVLKIYNFIGSNPFPNKWLEDAVEDFNFKDKLNIDFAQTKWGKILLKNVEDELKSYIVELNSIKRNLDKFPELLKASNIISSDIQKFENIKNNLDSWDKAYNLVQGLKFDRWSVDKKIILEEKEIAKEKREAIKEKFKKIKGKILLSNSEDTINDMYIMYDLFKILKNLVIEFSNEFSKKKRERNLIDFNDIEHMALKILVTTDKDGNKIPSEVAKKEREKYEEIAIDEYQDSNLVQEFILRSISKGNNIFMVGDVKQSIYRFRQARPELFIQKYETYKLKDSQKEGDNLKIQLFKNFRSRQNVLDITNMIFQNIMSKELGEIVYNEEEYLNLGAEYKEPEENIEYAGKTEIDIINLEESTEENEEEYTESEDNEEDSEEDKEPEEKIEDIVLEAKFVAQRIQELIESKYQVYTKTGYRNIQYKDIVVLLRSTKTLAPIYEKELALMNFPVFTDTGTQYLESVEIQTIIALLKIIDNPKQDIPLVTVLRSPIGQFDDNELVEIKLKGTTEKTKYFYDILINAKDKVEKQLAFKINNLLEKLDLWRKQQEYLALDELIWKIYLDTGYYDYVGLMQNGALRQANLKLLFEKAKQYEHASFKGLFNFINFIEKLKTNNGDMDSAKLIGENEDVIRIMSIHKSKGLEFPVVFLSGTAKRFNFQDLNQNIILHQDLGFGPKYIDYERRIEYNTLAKEAIKIKVKKETLSEEMRILYVALTRAKEKLIITGISKNVTEEIEKKQDLLDMYNDKYVNKNIVSQYKSYIDWIQLVYLKNVTKMKELVNFNIVEKDNIINNKKKVENNEQIIFEDNKKTKEKVNNKILEKLNWEYSNKNGINIPTKTSVTKIKEMKNNNTQIEKTEEKQEEEPIRVKPKFMQEEIKITRAEIGTLMHLCIQKLDEKQEYTYEKIKSLIEKLVQDEIITKKEAENINITAILKYTQSEIWNNLKNAKAVYKEQPFYINIPASKIVENAEEQQILVQGIIDMYYINENDEIVLVDYKTDYVTDENKQILVTKYKEQLELYKKALEEATKEKVVKMYIYSLCLNVPIEIK